jgi:hypothetical protein
VTAAGGEPTSVLLRQAQRDRDEAEQSLRDTVADLLATQKALAASQADLTQARAERTELLSILARIGDALSPTGERPQEALGTLAADVEELMENLPCGWCGGVGEAQEEMFGRDADGAPMVDGPQPCPEGCEIPAWLRAERNDAADAERERGEALHDLAHARFERDMDRTRLAHLREEMAAARLEIDQLRAELHEALGLTP